MDASALSGVLTRETLNRPTPTASRSTAPGKEDFMRLLVAQMRNQNPLEPLKDAEFMGQLTQFSTLEGITQLNKSFGDMLAFQQLTQGASLIGKSVTFEKTGSTIPGRGVVDGVKIDNGTFQLQVDGKAVPLSQVRSIEK